MEKVISLGTVTLLKRYSVEFLTNRTNMHERTDDTVHVSEDGVTDLHRNAPVKGSEEEDCSVRDNKNFKMSFMRKEIYLFKTSVRPRPVHFSEKY